MADKDMERAERDGLRKRNEVLNTQNLRLILALNAYYGLLLEARRNGFLFTLAAEVVNPIKLGIPLIMSDN